MSIWLSVGFLTVGEHGAGLGSLPATATAFMTTRQATGDLAVFGIGLHTDLNLLRWFQHLRGSSRRCRHIVLVFNSANAESKPLGQTPSLRIEGFALHPCSSVQQRADSVHHSSQLRS
ncbi:MAG: hypothetical protein JWQ87_5514 [Candidatus Sulfotelmatobacter sp.]|nr:hypothetical protein [Candidatus Sulfotelmatobacter sp.]